MKTLKFSESKPELILKGEKNITWRINDEKNITVGDEISMCRTNGDEFARAEVVSVKEKALGDLTEEDKDGHERFESIENIIHRLSELYGVKVTPKTKLKIIKFKLLSHKTQS